MVSDLAESEALAEYRETLAEGISAEDSTAVLLAASGVGVMPRWHAAVLIVVGATSVVGMLVLQLLVQHRYGARQIRRILGAGSPRWMRWVCYGLSLAGLAQWFYMGFSRYEPPSGGVSSLMAGTIGLVLFPAGFVMFYSYSKMQPELSRRCSQGDEVPMGALFCPQCGESVRSAG